MSFFFKKKMLKFYISALFFFFIMNILLDNMLINSIYSAFGLGGHSLGLESTLNRIDILKKGLDITSQHPLLGHGVGVTGYPSVHHSSLLPGGSFITDNYYLKLLIETGILGTIIFITILVLGIKKGMKTFYYCQDHFLKYTCLGLTFGIVILSINNFANSVLELPAINSVLWIILGLISSISYSQNNYNS
jgi:O-antigen ligase